MLFMIHAQSNDGPYFLYVSWYVKSNPIASYTDMKINVEQLEYLTMHGLSTFSLAAWIYL